MAFYKNQLTKFYKIGLGNKTEFGVTVDEPLINATKRRLMEISASILNPALEAIDYDTSRN